MIVTIDGPAGAGKSSTARALAGRLGFRFLDTGAMYRAVALAAIRRELPWDQALALADLAGRLDILVTDTAVWLDGDDVTREIRAAAITKATHHAANNPGVRARLVELQRQTVGDSHVVTEGRDQGTVVFPQAQCKIFLFASPEERARRRVQELTERGEEHAFEQVLADQHERDRGDASRAVGPLAKAADAIEFCTDNLSPDEVVDRLEAIVRARMEP